MNALSRNTWIAAAILTASGFLFKFWMLSAALLHTVSRDQWRFLPIVEKYYTGNLQFIDLVESHSNHIKIGYKSLFLLNAILFDLNMRMEIMFGLGCLAAALLIMLPPMRRTLREAPNYTVLLVLLVMLFVALSEGKGAYFRYSLLTVSSFTGLLIFMGIWTLTDRYIRHPNAGAWTLAGVSVLLVAMIFGFGGGRSPAVIAATLLSFAAISLALPHVRPRTAIALLAILVVSAGLQFLYWSTIAEVGSRTNVGKGIATLLADPTGGLAFALRALAASVLHGDVLKALTYNTQLAVGAVISLLHVAAAFLYFKTGMHRKTTLPLLLMTYSAFFVGELLVARFGLGFGNATAPRYTAETAVGLLGVTWIFGVYLVERVRSGNVLQPASIMIVALMMLFVSVEVANVRADQAFLKYRKASYERNIQKILDQRFTRGWFCPVVEICEEGNRILQKYNLAPYTKE